MEAGFSPSSLPRKRWSVSPIYDGDKRTEDSLNCGLAAATATVAAIDISISSLLLITDGRAVILGKERGGNEPRHQHEFWVSFSEAVSATNEGGLRHGALESRLGSSKLESST